METLDGFSMFRFGADYARLLPKALRVDFGTEREAEILEKIPGPFGDARPVFTPGRISLVSQAGLGRGKAVKARQRVTGRIKESLGFPGYITDHSIVSRSAAQRTSQAVLIEPISLSPA